jgi:hypothetical protein
MKSRVVLALSALLIGSALGTLHGCGSETASAGPGGTAGTGGTTGGGTCPPVECVTPGPTQITTYADLLATLKTGARVRAVLDYGKCTISGSPGPDALGAMSLDTFEWFNKGVVGNSKAYIAASENKLIAYPPGHVYDYVKVRVYDDEKVQIGVQYLDPVTFAVSVDETINCGISDAVTERGATFFKVTP